MRGLHHVREHHRYFKAPLSGEDSEHGAGTWYVEFMDGAAQRQFEVYADRTKVAPFDIKFADQYDSVVCDEHYEEISAEAFESAWKRFALARLRQIGRSDIR